MRNPNGFGSVVKLSGNRRNPYQARKTTGFNEKGYPIYLTIGYYPTREEGIIALAEYNKEPYNVNAGKMTLSELFVEWQNKKMHKLGESLKKNLNSAFKHTTNIQNMKYKDIRSFHMQDVIDNCGKGYSTQRNIQNLFGHLDKFALEIDVINKSYVQLTTTAPTPPTSRNNFTEDEIKLLWDNISVPYVDTILIFIYTGFRISEILEMKNQNIDLEEATFKGGTKTIAGKDRIVPIHPKIFEFVKIRYDGSNEYFLKGTKNVNMSEFKYYEIWHDIMNKLSMKHTVHECRHTFRSRLDSAGANKVCIDLLMGHKSSSTGERVYTHKTIEELKYTVSLVN